MGVGALRVLIEAFERWSKTGPARLGCLIGRAQFWSWRLEELEFGDWSCDCELRSRPYEQSPVNIRSFHFSLPPSFLGFREKFPG